MLLFDLALKRDLLWCWTVGPDLKQTYLKHWSVTRQPQKVEVPEPFNGRWVWLSQANAMVFMGILTTHMTSKDKHNIMTMPLNTTVSVDPFGKERASCHTKTRSSESSPSKQSLLRKATHRESSGGIGLRKSPRRCARRPHILPSTSSGKEEQLRASASSSEARQTRSMSLRKDDDLYLVHPKGDEFVRREYEKEETRLRNLAKPVTSSPERRSFLKSL